MEAGGGGGKGRLWGAATLMPKPRTRQGSRGASNQGRGMKGPQDLGSPQGEQAIHHWLEKGVQARGLLQLPHQTPVDKVLPMCFSLAQQPKGEGRAGHPAAEPKAGSGLGAKGLGPSVGPNAVPHRWHS